MKKYLIARRRCGGRADAPVEPSLNLPAENSIRRS